MKYKLSFYNIICVEKADIIVVFNSRSASLIEISKNIYLKFDGIEENCVNEEDTPLFEVMVSQGLLVPNDLDEIEYVKYLHVHSRDAIQNELYITIVPTYACNMVCSYCFQTEEKKHIDSSMCNKICEVIENLLEYKEKFEVSWFGGEPLLAIDVIESISKRLINYCDKRGIHYSADIVTNGSLLTEEVVDQLLACRITNVQITLDGIEQQRANRKLKNNKDSYSVVAGNVVTASNKLDVLLRCNVASEGDDDIKAMLYDMLVTRKLAGKIHIHFAQVTDYTGRSKQADYSSYCSTKVFSERIVELIKYVTDYQSPDTVFNLDIEPTVFPCGAITGSKYAIDLYGNIYKCELAMQNEKGRIATVDQVLGNEVMLYTKGHLKWLNLTMDSECERCKYLPLCQGGCSWDRIDNKRQCSIDEGLFTTIMRYKYEESLKEYDEHGK